MHVEFSGEYSTHAPFYKIFPHAGGVVTVDLREHLSEWRKDREWWHPGDPRRSTELFWAHAPPGVLDHHGNHLTPLSASFTPRARITVELQLLERDRRP